MSKAHRYTLPDRYYGCTVEDYGYQPGNSTYEQLPELPWTQQWPQFVEGQGWVLVEDHRERSATLFDTVLVQAATDYWLPDDTHTSPARHMTSIGKLPAGAMLVRPDKSLAEAQADKLAEIATAYDSVLAYVIAPEGKDSLAAALAVADFTADDPEGLAFIRTKLAARKKELEAQTTAAGTVAAVQAVYVSFAV